MKKLADNRWGLAAFYILVGGVLYSALPAAIFALFSDDWLSAWWRVAKFFLVVLGGGAFCAAGFIHLLLPEAEKVELGLGIGFHYGGLFLTMLLRKLTDGDVVAGFTVAGLICYIIASYVGRKNKPEPAPLRYKETTKRAENQQNKYVPNPEQTKTLSEDQLRQNICDIEKMIKDSQDFIAEFGPTYRNFSMAAVKADYNRKSISWDEYKKVHEQYICLGKYLTFFQSGIPALSDELKEYQKELDSRKK